MKDKDAPKFEKIKTKGFGTQSTRSAFGINVFELTGTVLTPILINTN